MYGITTFRSICFSITSLTTFFSATSAFFRECGVKGVFYNADTEGFGVEQIRYQLLAELNWRPDMTDEEYEALMCELLEKEYGEGWDCVRDYITMWDEGTGYETHECLLARNRRKQSHVGQPH